MSGVTDRARLHWGVSLGETLLVALLIGVMLALTLGNVLNIFVKTAATEALSLSAPIKLYWAERWANDGPQETSALPADTPGLRGTSKYFALADVEQADGAVTFAFNDQFSFMDGRQITMRAASGPGEYPATLVWICGRAPVPHGFTVRGVDRTDTDTAQLPSPCRAHP